VSADPSARRPGAPVVSDPKAHAASVRRMFARIARVYDFMNHALSLNRDRRWRRNVARRLDPTTWELVDVCAGTGDLGLACLEDGRAREAFAVDFCADMLHAGRGKGLGRSVPAAAGDTLALPLRDACCDAVVAGFGMRNLADLPRGLAEVRRVLRPGGQFLTLEFFRADTGGAGPERGAAAPVRMGLAASLPLLGRLLGRDRDAYAYLNDSMGRFLTPREYAAQLEQAGFGEVFVERQTLGIAHIVGGRLPGC